MNKKIEMSTDPKIIVRVDRHLDHLLEEEREDPKYSICEILCKLRLATPDEVKCWGEDGGITYHCFYVSTEELQELMEENHV